MLDMVLRIYGEQFDVALFCNKYPEMAISTLFKKGELDILGNSNEFSGFDVIISENETVMNGLQKTKQFLDLQEQAFTFLKNSGVNCFLDLDVTVGPVGEMPAPLNLSAEFLGVLHHYNISIEFSAYPSNEGA
jgi:hypothetical protein|tara:strand:+ start:284 stop:682 length:399 start_codon:yes stop_codon:yes gene_type:complete